MAHVNKVLRSINDQGADRCVDIYFGGRMEPSASRNSVETSRTRAAGFRSVVTPIVSLPVKPKRWLLP
ncbi:hypothetical protein [Rhizobium leguminosarum]|uniref:hypothetical protein n=1 Tax=Rhizobium leguminosarum TaxID=384 RepID=UPI0024A94904|nr:hypothetical protein [Rhizobium leguminosarum]MDI5926711.1 hypothetical protein [Rhizobium leguminosarum]